MTKSEGGSSVKVSIGEDKTAKLEIYVSASRHMRNCALITDFPEQLVAALELEPAEVDLPDLHLLLQVPLASLKTLLVRRGITGGDTADDYEEISGTDFVNEASQSQGDDASTRSANSVWSDSSESVIVESTRASARSEAANPTLRPHVDHRPGFRLTTPELQSQDQLNVPSDEGPSERPVTSYTAVAGLYSTANRNRNRERLQGFARNADPASSSRPGRARGQSGDGGGSFDMSTLRETLEAAEPTPVSTPIQVNPNPRRRTGPIRNRDKEEMARDFEVGFLGEQFVCPLLSLACHTWPG